MEYDKNPKARRVQIKMSNFKIWTQENLAQFAEEANNKMVEQNERIEQLQRDVKDAIEAYRALIRKNESQRDQ